MAKISVPKIVRTLDLGEYAEEMRGTAVQVWVNPPRGLLMEYSGLAAAIVALRVDLQDVARLADAAQGTEDKQAEIRLRAEPLAQRLDEIGRGQMEILAQLWSQGPEDTRWTVEDVQALVSQCADSDPALVPWLRERTMQMIAEYRAGQKKG